MQSRKAMEIGVRGAPILTPSQIAGSSQSPLSSKASCGETKKHRIHSLGKLRHQVRTLSFSISSWTSKEAKHFAWLTNMHHMQSTWKRNVKCHWAMLAKYKLWKPVVILKLIGLWNHEVIKLYEKNLRLNDFQSTLLQTFEFLDHVLLLQSERQKETLLLLLWDHNQTSNTKGHQKQSLRTFASKRAPWTCAILGGRESILEWLNSPSLRNTEV